MRGELGNAVRAGERGAVQSDRAKAESTLNNSVDEGVVAVDLGTSTQQRGKYRNRWGSVDFTRNRLPSHAEHKNLGVVHSKAPLVQGVNDTTRDVRRRV